MRSKRKPKWIPPRENTGSRAASAKKSDHKNFWKNGGIWIVADGGRTMKTPHETRRRKYKL